MKYNKETTHISDLPQKFDYNGKECVKWYDGLWHVLKQRGKKPTETPSIKILTKDQVIDYLNEQ